MNHDDHVLADRVDTEPPIFKGCSSSELLFLLLASAAVWLPLSVLLALAIGKLTMALAFLTVGVIGSVYLAALVFQRVKRNRPDHYYVHALKRRLRRAGLWSYPLIWRSGYWDTGRDGRQR